MALTFHPPKPGRIATGGYILSYAGHVGAGMRLVLGLPDAANGLDVTGRPATSSGRTTCRSSWRASAGPTCGASPRPAGCT